MEVTIAVPLVKLRAEAALPSFQFEPHTQITCEWKFNNKKDIYKLQQTE